MMATLRSSIALLCSTDHCDLYSLPRSTDFESRLMARHLWGKLTCTGILAVVLQYARLRSYRKQDRYHADYCRISS